MPDQEPWDLVVIGGGAAGFFAAITSAEAQPGSRVLILEKTAHVLGKVRISGGGRCNVTHACFDPKTLAGHYPRGSKSLIGPFHRWGADDTVEWFQSRGVELKTEADGFVDVFNRCDAYRATGTGNQPQIRREHLAQLIFIDGVRLPTADFHDFPRAGRFLPNGCSKLLCRIRVTIFINVFHGLIRGVKLTDTVW